MLLAFAAVLGLVRAPAASECDAFCYLAQANKASLVMLVETGLVSETLGAEIAKGIGRVVDEQGAEGARRSSNYLDFETRLIEIAGEPASQIHLGRSRQDLHGTVRRMQLRAGLLASLESLFNARTAVLDLASRYPDVVVPAYTHGVQAQPTSFGHYLLAFSAAFQRDGERLVEQWARLNRCPLGAGPLGTSGFALDRNRLAQLLGFDGPIENSYDANLVASMDAKVEFAHALALSALHVGQFVENIHTQYHDPAPWLILGEGETSTSTSMPQKRNPRPLDRIRTDATAVLGGAQLVALYAHNTNTGMHDYRSAAPALELAERHARMLDRYRRVVAGLVVDRTRALEEINDDYATMSEVADTLVREARIPFRTAHRYASELTRHGRTKGVRPIDMGDDDLARIYRETIGAPLAVDVGVIRNAMDPEKLVAARRGLGGPQPDSVEAMLAAHRAEVEEARDWLAVTWRRLEVAGTDLDAAFDSLTPP